MFNRVTSIMLSLKSMQILDIKMQFNITNQVKNSSNEDISKIKVRLSVIRQTKYLMSALKLSYKFEYKLVGE